MDPTTLSNSVFLKLFATIIRLSLQRKLFQTNPQSWTYEVIPTDRGTNVVIKYIVGVNGGSESLLSARRSQPPNAVVCAVFVGITAAQICIVCPCTNGWKTFSCVIDSSNTDPSPLILKAYSLVFSSSNGPFLFKQSTNQHLPNYPV